MIQDIYLFNLDNYLSVILLIVQIINQYNKKRKQDQRKTLEVLELEYKVKDQKIQRKNQDKIKK